MTRKILLASLLLIIALLFGVKAVYSDTASLSFFPTTILQGDPLLVQINGIAKISLIKKLTFDGKNLGIFTYQNKPSALVGIDFYKKSGNYELIAELVDGTFIKNIVTVGAREVAEEPLGIPTNLGGNTKASQDKLVTTLVAEWKTIAEIRTNKKALWNEKFIPPLKQLFITSPYGISRKTGEYSIPHVGLDYGAKEGTAVMAVNRGVVRVAMTYRNYGKTIFIDHGLGILSSYLHLSKIKVKVGDVVARGQVIGLSGQTGYSSGPHLHLGIRIDQVVIDPVKFFELFK